MKLPKLSRGITGFYNAKNEFVCTGAAMGRMSSTPSPCTPGAKFSVTKMKINSGGYDSAGAYWGIGENLYRAYSEEGNGEETQECFIRANSRAGAKRYVVSRFLGAKFYR